MMRKPIASALVLVLLLSETGTAAPRRSVSSFDFLALDANARAAALGGAYTALASDSNALQYNPAGLGRMRHHEVTLMHNSYVGGVNHEHLGLASRAGLGASVNYLSFGSIPRTTISQPSPSPTLGDFGLSDLSAAVGYGRTLGRGVSAGAAYKYIRESADDVRASGHAFDAGLMWTPSFAQGLTLGASARNMGPAVRFQRERERLPLTLRSGAAYEFEWDKRPVLLSADLIGQRDSALQFAVGAETTFGKTVSLRMGWSSRNQADIGLTAGAGMRIRDLSVDYAIVPFGDLELAHRMSVTFRWGRTPPPESVVIKGPWIAGSRAALPSDPDLLLDHAEALLKLGRFAEAKARLDAAIALLDPGNHRLTKLYERLGWTFWCLGAYAKSKAAYAESLRLASELGMSEPGVTESYLGMGLILKQEGDAAQAVGYFRTVIEREAEGPSARRAREQLILLKAPETEEPGASNAPAPAAEDAQ